jgi:hypothetical protein
MELPQIRIAPVHAQVAVVTAKKLNFVFVQKQFNRIPREVKYV